MSATTVTPAAIRPGVLGDLPALTEIYNHYVTGSNATFDVTPFSVPDRQAWFDHYAATGPHRLLVADADGEVLGYATSSPLRPKPAYDTSVETTIYCRPDAVGQGLGRRLYEALLAGLAREDLHRAYAGIAVPNDASVALHRAIGFTPLGTYREVGRKFGRYWDVAWFELALPYAKPRS
ncbi:GNAT family N-acetyltransferase [Angustibacter luteus]|uniref:N-acetyltransferase family protein n=1 Tax=Angustibacter luteus TaxID=658456 RepID=A0ABW1JJ38_9ACTN